VDGPLRLHRGCRDSVLLIKNAARARQGSAMAS